MYEKILVAVDDSEYSRAAVIEAANWVRRHGGSIILVHGVYFDEEEFSNAPEQLEKRFKAGMEFCAKRQNMVESEFGIKVNMFVREGEPHEVIANMAREQGADMIAIGTHGRMGLKRVIMGSVAASVVTNSPSDVLVVKKPCSECTGVYSSILLPFDGSEFSRKSLKRVCQLSREDDVEITVLYVIPRYEEMIGFLKTDSIRKGLLQEAEKIIDSAKEMASSQGVSIKTQIEEGHASSRIIETSLKLKNDLIVMSTYGWRGFNKAIMGSTTERVLTHAPCPILVVR